MTKHSKSPGSTSTNGSSKCRRPVPANPWSTTSNICSNREGEPVSVGEAVRILGVVPSTVHRWVNDEFIAAEQVTPGSPRRILVAPDLRARFVEEARGGWLPMLEASRATRGARNLSSRMRRLAHTTTEVAPPSLAGWSRPRWAVRVAWAAGGRSARGGPRRRRPGRRPGQPGRHEPGRSAPSPGSGARSRRGGALRCTSGRTTGRRRGRPRASRSARGRSAGTRGSSNCASE